MYEDVPVAQLDRVSASDAEGRGFESLRVRHLKAALSRRLFYKRLPDKVEPGFVLRHLNSFRSKNFPYSLRCYRELTNQINRSSLILLSAFSGYAILYDLTSLTAN